jgi:hypothetical protein
MTTVTDEEMQAALACSRIYCVVILKKGPKYDDPESRAIIKEHGRRNLALRKEGVLPIICASADKSEMRGVGVFNSDEAETKRIMEGDPGVQAGIFTYETHPVRSFPGFSLPDKPA